MIHHLFSPLKFTLAHHCNLTCQQNWPLNFIKKIQVLLPMEFDAKINMQTKNFKNMSPTQHKMELIKSRCEVFSSCTLTFNKPNFVGLHEMRSKSLEQTLEKAVLELCLGSASEWFVPLTVRLLFPIPENQWCTLKTKTKHQEQLSLICDICQVP